MREEIRKLAAIMFTDMVGFSAMSQENEKQALDLLDEHRSMLRSVFPLHHGKEIKTIGDAFLVEFPSALDATLCAVSIQNTIAQHNDSVQDRRKFAIRIGIHIGDVVSSENDIYGDGVNIASRIEPLAWPGGICLSEDVARQVQNKLDVPLEKVEKATLKNIQLPVEIYRIQLHAKPAASSKRPNFDTLKIAVLPFDNISPDNDTDYFSDGLTEELITHLSAIKNLHTVSRTTSMQYKNTKKDMSTIGRELNARYILEGSVRKMGEDLRITGQLIDVETDSHLWAKTYKGKLADIFEIQEEVSRQIADALRLKLTPEEKVELGKRSTLNTEAFDFNLRARELMYRYSKSGLQSSILLFEKAIELDPRYATAYAGLGEVYALLYAWREKKDLWIDKAMETSFKALMYDSTLSEAYSSLSLAYFAKSAYDEALTAALKSIELDSNNFFSYWVLGRIYYNTKRDKLAAEAYTKSMEINPDYYTAANDLRVAYQLMGEDSKADELLRRNIAFYPDYLLKHPDDARAQMFFAQNLAEARMIDEAKVEAARAIALEPMDTLLLYNAACFYSIIGETELSLDHLERAINSGFKNFDHIARDPDLEAIREEPAFERLVQRH